jgi:hypothetical protein
VRRPARYTARRCGGRIHEAWKRSDLNQREYCEAQGLSLNAFGNWRAKFKAEPQLPARKLLYRRGCASHSLGHTASHSLGHVTYPSFALAGGIVPPPRAAIGRRFSESDRSQITPPSCPLTRARRLPEESRSRGWHILNAGTDVTASESRVGAEALKSPRQAEANPADEPDNAATAAPD